MKHSRIIQFGLLTTLLFYVAETAFSQLAYMDIHKKYSHSKYFSDWGKVIKSEKENYTYFYTYNTGWIEGITVEHCASCHGQGGSTCMMCYGNGATVRHYPYTHYEPCMMCHGSGFQTCIICKGKATYARIEALHDEGDGYLKYYVALNPDGSKGQMSYLNNKSSSNVPSAPSSSVPINSYPRNDNGGSSNSSSSALRCNSCAGTGKCGSCAGRGYKYSNYVDHDIDCTACKGGGICPICNGRGKF